MRKRTTDDKDRLAAVDFVYGMPPVLPGQPARSYSPVPLMPGQAADLILSDLTRDEFYGLLRLEECSTDIPEVTLWLDRVAWYGEDNKMWIRGRMHQLDPNDSRHWMPVGNPNPVSPLLNHTRGRGKIQLSWLGLRLPNRSLLDLPICNRETVGMT